MPKKKSSGTKRSKVESTNNKTNNLKQDQVEDKKPDKKSLNEKRRAGISKDQNLPSNERFDNKPCYTKSAKDSNNRISDKDSVGDNSKLNRGYGKKISNLPEDGESVLEEINEDIFTLSNEYSLAHCVAEDLRMGAGIAVDFKNKFGGVGKLIDQGLKIGDVGIVKRHEQYVFYLITKKNSNGKPTMMTMNKALCSLLRKMKEYNLTKLAIPKIGCGLDKLDWSNVTKLINQIFSGSGIHITVCIPSKILDAKAPSPRLKVFFTPNNLWEMEPQTHITVFVYLEEVYRKNWTSDIVDKVDSKYPFKENFLKDIKNNKKFKPGDIKIYKVKNEVIICMFTTQTSYYSSLEKGFLEIKHQTNKHFKYMAIQSGPIGFNDNFQRILWTVLIWRSIINNSELWLCGDPEQKHGTVYDQYCKDLFGPMNNSFNQHNPSQMDGKYNDNHFSLNTSNQH